MKKRMLCLVLALMLVIGLLPALCTEATAATLTLSELQSKFPTGTYWNHYVSNYEETGDRLKATWNESFANSITYSPCVSHNMSNTVGYYDCNFFDGGMQCCGFARKLAYDAYGSRATTWNTSSSVKPGDVVWFKSAITDSTYGHWVFVYAVSGNYITVGEANVEGNLCMIRWGKTYDMSQFYSYTIYSAPWELSYADNSLDIGDDFYARIINPTRNMYVSNDGDNVSLRSASGGVNQIWFFDRQQDGSYLIRSARTGKVLDVADASAGVGANVQTFEQNRSDAQKWTITGNAGAYHLSALCTPCVMDVANADWYEGTNIQMCTRNGNNAQDFDIEKLNGLSPLPHVTSNKTVYVPGEQVTVSWSQVYCADRYRIDVRTESGPYLVAENLGISTTYTFRPANPGVYTVYVTATMVDTDYVSDPYTFTVSGSKSPFTDVPAGSFYEDAVLWAVEEGITNGLTATEFGPTTVCNRAQVVTFLWRAAGSPEPETAVHSFVDVQKGSFYEKAVLWAVEKGITTGTDATHFSPGTACNRATVVTFLYRAFESPAVENADNPFSDVPEKSWYTAPVLWAVEQGITNGLTATTFGPTQSCNRAQVVTFLYRAYND